KLTDHLSFWPSRWIGEFKRTVAHVSAAAHLSAKIEIQVAREVQQEMTDAVSIRIRPRPELLIGERRGLVEYFLCCFLIITGEIGGDCRSKCVHPGDSSKNLPPAV